MPWTGTRSTILLIGTAIGLAGSGSAQAEPQGRPDASFVLAQNTQQQTDQQDEERKRRQKGQQQQQDRQQHQQDQRNRGNQQFNQGDRGNADRDRGNAEHDRALRDQADKERERKLKDQADKDRFRKDAEREERERKLREQADKDRLHRDAEKDKDREKAEHDRKLREEADKERERKLKEQADKDRLRKDAERDHLRDLKDKAKGRVEDHRDRIEQKVEDRKISREELEKRRKERHEFSRERLADIARQRHERREEGGRIVIEEPDSRRIIRDRGRIIIQHNEIERLRGAARDVHVEHGPDGGSRTVIMRSNGIQIITIEDRDGHLIRRLKRYPDGREIVLINNEYHRRHRDRDRDSSGFYVTLPFFALNIPQHDYYLYADQADEDEIEQILSAPPVEDLEEDYTLDEIRYSPDIRKRFRKLNLNTVTFEFGSWEVRESQIDKLAVVARAITHIIDRNPDEVFLIGGYTDAVGSDEDNLSLSDRRAESVARVLADEFGVPPENLVTQGYGESELLIDTQGPEERNRRVELMRITNYLAQKD